MTEKDKDTPDWKRHPSGLYLPAGVPEHGKRPVVGFAAALEKPKNVSQESA